MPQLQVQTDRPSYSPGETVRGSVRAIEGGSSRAGTAQLRYVESTDDYTEIGWEQTVRLWDGDLPPNASFAFEIALPADAKPGYRSPNGALAWDVCIRSDEFGPDTTVAQEIEVVAPVGGYPLPTDAPSTARGPAWVKPMYFATPAVGAGVGYSVARVPGAIGGAALMGGSSLFQWHRRAKHFAVEPPPPVRRGERARVSVRMVDAAEVRGELEAGIECEERYDYRSHTSKSATRRTQEETLHEERVPLGAGQRSADIAIPAEMPFSYAGSCVSYVWKAVVRERRENAPDRIAEAPLLVLP